MDLPSVWIHPTNRQETQMRMKTTTELGLANGGDESYLCIRHDMNESTTTKGHLKPYFKIKHKKIVNKQAIKNS